MDRKSCWPTVIFRSALLSIICFTITAANAALVEQTNLLSATPAKLKKLSLEELMNVEITSVSKREEKINQAAAAVHVITEEDIRRSGARSIPEALRLAPNLHVTQVNSRDWGITARGFNGGTTDNKLLVLMDGRAIYTPLFSGVFWDVQDYMLSDLDRIEVISGPGGTLWGANAVNGVINIISKSAKDTQGFLASGGAGTERRGFGDLRYGGKLGENVYYRVYGKYFDRDDTIRRDGSDGRDSWRMGQGGLRVDWEVEEGTLMTLQGDGYHGVGELPNASHQSMAGGNVLGRWSRRISDDARWQLQAYYDYTHRRIPGTFAEKLDTYDVDSQYEFKLGDRNLLLAGLGYRFTKNNVENTPGLAFLPAKLERNTFSAFVQDEITLIEDTLKLTLGSKLENNDYTGFEFQPSGRIAWTGERQMVWGAISRAVRTPSRIDRHLYIPGTAPFILAGGPGFISEELIAYELGYRVQPHEKLFATAALFYNVYDNIRSVRNLGSTAAGPFVLANDVEGETYGVELQFTFQPIETWRLTAGYTWLGEDLREKPGRSDVNRGQGEINDPEQQLVLRSSFDLPRNIEFDITARYVDALHNVSGQTVPSYFEMDIRLGWMPTENWEIALVGQNLLDNQHPEFGAPSASRREIERGFYGKVTWRF